jgi:protein translocase SecG subunit
MSFIAAILTFILILNCLLLILLVLVQLPKKDAGAGLAFGGGAADALFGAGSGNALTKITKFGTVSFLVLALVLAHLEVGLHSSETSGNFAQQVQAKENQAPGQMAPSSLPTTPQSTPPSANNLLTIPLVSTNSIATPTTNLPK